MDVSFDASNAIRVPQTDSNRAEFREESSRAGFDVLFAPGMRYPEVAADLPPPPGKT
jgi:hypothetical protein